MKSIVPQFKVLYGKKYHIEAGLGMVIYSGSNFGYVGGDSYTGKLGLRYLKPEGGFTYGASFNMIYAEGNDYKTEFFPWGGLSVGYAF